MSSPRPGEPIRTVGHGTLDPAELAALLRSAGVDTLVDVRRYPGSKRHPQFGADAMAGWLPEHGIAYEHLPELGGRRRTTPSSPNVGLRNEQFRGYGDHMASAEFAAGIERLLELARAGAVAVMCAESVWWRCHRRLLADHLVLVTGIPVEHLFHDGRLTRHEPTREARRDGDQVVYDVGVPAQLFDD